MNKTKKIAEGYFTLEAALLTPMLLACLLLILYTGFYRYDACLLKQDACMLAVEGELPWKAEKTRESALSALQELYTEKYASFSLTQKELAVDEKSVTVALAGRLVVPTFQRALFPFAKEKFSVRTSIEGSRTNAASWIRNYRRLKELGEGLSGESYEQEK